jgi:hypothetical protein
MVTLYVIICNKKLSDGLRAKYCWNGSDFNFLRFLVLLLVRGPLSKRVVQQPKPKRGSKPFPGNDLSNFLILNFFLFRVS